MVYYLSICTLIWLQYVTCYKERDHSGYFIKIEFLAWIDSSICAESNGAIFMNYCWSIVEIFEMPVLTARTGTNIASHTVHPTTHWRRLAPLVFILVWLLKLIGNRVSDSTNRDVPDVTYAYTVHYKGETYFSSIKVLEFLTLFYEWFYT